MTSPERQLRGRAFVDGRIHEDVVIAWRGEAITSVRTAQGAAAAERVDGLIVPGFVDLHIHGGAGADFMDATPEAVRCIVAFHARHGTTTMAATTLSASRDAITRAIRAIARSREPGVAGIHLEGPYLNSESAGAQDRGSLRPADPDEVESWMSQAPHLAWIMTVAPEVPGVLRLIERLQDRVVFSIGHTGASYAQSIAALDKGASHFTHLFNGMAPLHHREPGPVGAALASSTATVELIADGVHVHPVLLGAMARLMPRRSTLVTDAIRACGMPEGAYRLYEHEVFVAGGAARLADGTLAGSVLTMIGAVRNMVQLAGLPIEEVLPLATEVPARVLGLEKRKGLLRPGYDADWSVLSPQLEVERVYARGAELPCR
jgi:N-acetylglucosamine-6-phosphate deacetylase